jgi:hypothetical protein
MMLGPLPTPVTLVVPSAVPVDPPLGGVATSDDVLPLK